MNESKMQSIFESSPIPNEDSRTITTRLGSILAVAEKKYGERDKSYTLLGVEITKSDRPQIWYPGNCKNVVIQITEDCLNDMNRAVFQVAHETIHCLCPTGGRNANVLEEGIAVLFSIEYCRENGYGDSWTPEIREYTNAYELVKQILKIDDEIITKLRSIQPTISSIDKHLILKTNNKVPEELADKLTKKFLQ